MSTTRSYSCYSTQKSSSRHGSILTSTLQASHDQASESSRSTSRRRGKQNPYKNARSVVGKGESQRIVCAISEGRGISPTVGLASVNITNGEAILSQICDNQFYIRLLNKIEALGPTEILIISAYGPPNPKSKMYLVIEENISCAKLVTIDRKYWSETAGLDYIQNLAFHQDIEAIKVAVAGNYFATCCLAAALKYIELSLSLTFAFHSLRIKYQASEGSMMIDLSTVQSLELIQNLQNSKSKDCLFGLMNETLTPMGTRLLKSNILQPSTQAEVLAQRYQALEELITKEEIFMQTRQGLSVYLFVLAILLLS
ncbi:MutS protein-like protein 4 [Erysiphe neolycopersici]|uniref:MutS protein-like protein 4 n=1 Tax=Erysiphe neolycopersici TaxID=212602 RepID=A0A420HT51_9PEZI|nr:MutS protein-like protein 4 [Erysiphe neolycopersici]